MLQRKGSGDRNLMQFQRFRSPAPARLTRDEESPGWTHLHLSQLLPKIEAEPFFIVTTQLLSIMKYINEYLSWL